MKNVAVFLIWIGIAIVFALFQASPVCAQKNDAGFWPKKIIVNGDKVIMYQP